MRKSWVVIVSNVAVSRGNLVRSVTEGTTEPLILISGLLEVKTRTFPSGLFVDRSFLSCGLWTVSSCYSNSHGAGLRSWLNAKSRAVFRCCLLWKTQPGRIKTYCSFTWWCNKVIQTECGYVLLENNKEMLWHLYSLKYGWIHLVPSLRQEWAPVYPSSSYSEQCVQFFRVVIKSWPRFAVW